MAEREPATEHARSVSGLRAPTDHARLRLACAYMRHVRRPPMGTKDIARRLGVAPARVSRLLREAVDLGLVLAYLNAPHHEALEAEILDAFHDLDIRDVRVAPAWPGQTESDARRAVGQVAARCFEELEEAAGSEIRVGVSGGLTLHEMVRAMRPPKPGITRVEVCAMTGSALTDASSSANATSALLCSRYAAVEPKPRVGEHPLQESTRVVRGFELPFRFEGAEQKERALALPEVADAYNRARDVQIAVIGVGTLTEGSTLRRNLRALGIPHTQLQLQGAKGEVLGSTLKRTGEVVETTLKDHILAVPLEDLQRLSADWPRSIIGLACGADKAETVLGAIRARAFNMLVTDEMLATELMKIARTATDRH